MVFLQQIQSVDVPDEFSGTVIQKLSLRKGELQGMGRTMDGRTLNYFGKELMNDGIVKISSKSGLR